MSVNGGWLGGSVSVTDRRDYALDEPVLGADW